MRNFFIAIFFGILMTVGLISAAIAEDSSKDNPKPETYQTGPFGQREEDQQDSNDYLNSTDQGKTGENGQTDQTQSQDNSQSGDSQSNDSQSGTGQSGDSK